MSIDTKGFVLTPEKNPWLITGIVEKSIRDRLLSQVPPEITRSKRNRRVCVDARMISTSEMVCLDFESGDDHRILHLFFTCDHSYEHVALGPKIIFSLGCHGDSVGLITDVGLALKEKVGGRFFLHENDCCDYSVA